MLWLQISLNYSPRVTHVIASRTDRFEFTAQVRAKRDVVCMEWLTACAREQRRLPIQPHQYLNLTEATRCAMPDVDRFGDLCALNPGPCALS